MGDDEGEIAQIDAAHGKQQHQRNTGNDFGVDDGEVGHIHHKGTGLAPHAEDADGCRGAQQGRQQRGYHGDEEGVGKGLKDDLVVEQFLVPLEGEPGPNTAGFVFIERIDDENEDGRIQEEHDQAHIAPGEPALFHSSIASLSSPSSNIFIIAMQIRIMTISTIEMAAPRLGL